MENKDFLADLDLDNEINQLEEIQHNNLEQLENTDNNTEYKIVDESVIVNKSEQELKEELDLLLKEAHNTVNKEETKENNIFSYIIWFFKYITTSALIFAILLLTTNYSAYYNIAKSYLYKDELKQEQNSLLNSVSAAQITKKIKSEKKIEEKLNKEKKENKAKIKKYSIKKLVNIADKNTPKLDIDITPYENRIIIPKIAKNIPLIDIKNQKVDWPKQLENIFMKELEDWVIRYPGSTKPGRPWNTFVFWHSSNFPWIKWDYNDVFALLDNVSYDDEVIMYYNQKKYVYKIKEKRVIKPGDVSVLKRNQNKDELTLMTCWPVWTTLNRLIVTWELVEE